MQEWLPLRAGGTEGKAGGARPLLFTISTVFTPVCVCISGGKRNISNIKIRTRHLFWGCLRQGGWTEVRFTNAKGMKLKQFKGISVAITGCITEECGKCQSYHPVAFIPIGLLHTVGAE